ncbi:hypothetical protein M9980_11805 [Sphingomonas donggukensis]|uniref:Uncharacterized protein n=1 Tax=Sphingomonas donggukensis TaxID=2949093 RepID=A0ABY4TTQ0_9SPHN|nr:hypothetical protein [Sphingomonas donggukensis]URW75220.1 hypothetical protein M9980_11805 [Sphingomonas donggukensis]
MMPTGFFTRFAPIRAINDLRHFMALQKPTHVVFLVLSLMLTMAVLLGFVIDSHVERPYKRNIVYAENWRADRSEAEIRAAQLREMAVKTRRDIVYEKKQADLKAQFKRLDDKLEKWGI